MTKADASLLCKEAIKYPMLLTSVVPIYLSIVRMFIATLPSSMKEEVSGFINTCNYAVDIVKEEVKNTKVRVNYNPGYGHFVWPPSE